MLFVFSMLMAPVRMVQRALMLHPAYWGSVPVIVDNLSSRARFLFTTRIGLFVLLMLLTVLGSMWSDLNENGNGLTIIVSVVVGLVLLRVAYGFYVRYRRAAGLKALQQRQGAVLAGEPVSSGTADIDDSTEVEFEKDFEDMVRLRTRERLRQRERAEAEARSAVADTDLFGE